MDPHELRRQAGAVQIIDVRWPNEWDAGHIEGSTHVPQDELDDHLEELDKNRMTVTVCRTGNRSGVAAETLRAEGFRAVSLEGGLVAWADAGLPLVASDGTAGRVVEPEPPPDDRPETHQRLQEEFLSVLFAVQDHFGDREPSDEEIRSFLRQRLIDEGRSPEEADEFLARMDDKA